MELQLNQIRFDDDDASILPLTSLCSALHVTDYMICKVFTSWWDLWGRFHVLVRASTSLVRP